MLCKISSNIWRGAAQTSLLTVAKIQFCWQLRCMNNKKEAKIPILNSLVIYLVITHLIFIIIQSSINARDFHENSSSSVVSQNLIFLFSGPDAGDMTVLILLSSFYQKKRRTQGLFFFEWKSQHNRGRMCLFHIEEGVWQGGAFRKENFIIFSFFCKQKSLWIIVVEQQGEMII